MQISQQRFEAYERHQEMSGVLNIQIFNACEDTLENHRSALASVLELSAPKPLEVLSPKRISQAAFHGDFFDKKTGHLVPGGQLVDDYGNKITKPYLTDIHHKKGSSYNPPGGQTGSFAFAYLLPPYGLFRHNAKLTNIEIEQTYLEMCDYMMPSKNNHILNWVEPKLIEIAPHLEKGMEWWGVYAYTIHNAEKRMVSAIVAAETD
jgi:hypothetical protein